MQCALAALNLGELVHRGHQPPPGHSSAGCAFTCQFLTLFFRPVCKTVQKAEQGQPPFSQRLQAPESSLAEGEMEMMRILDQLRALGLGNSRNMDIENVHIMCTEADLLLDQ